MTEQQPRRIGIVGFADSRVEAPYADPSWEFWGVNDIVLHVAQWGGRIDQTFELHSLTGLLERGRRSPKYPDWLRKGKQAVYMVEPQPDFPSAQRFPFEELAQVFPRKYFTNSISWMTAFAIMQLTDVYPLADGRMVRIAKPGAQLGFWGVDMAAGGENNEYASQRPSCEYFVGIAEGCQLPVYIPDTSDLCKAGALYGIDTTLPLRKKLELKMAAATQSSLQCDQQLAQLQAQREQILFNKGQAVGAKQMAAYVRGVYTNSNEEVPSEEERAKRHNLPVENKGNGKASSSGVLHLEPAGG